jgi:hypothetical protein
MVRRDEHSTVTLRRPRPPAAALPRFALLFAMSAVLCALAAVPAGAATPFNVGTGREPQVAVDPSGVGHVVWQIEDGDDRIGYCRVAKNGTTCDLARELSFPHEVGDSPVGQGSPQVFAPSVSKIVIVGACFTCGSGSDVMDRSFRWMSANGGFSFPGLTEVANGVNPDGDGAYVETGDVVVGIGGSVSGGSKILAGPTSLGTSPVSVLAGGHGYSPSVVRVPGYNQLVAASSSLDATSYSVFSGALTPANINNAANWSGAQPPTAPVDDDESSLGAGGAGVFLAFKRFIPNDNQVIVQPYDPVSKAFGAPAAIEGPSPIDNHSADYTDIAVDNAGPHVIWRTLFDGGRLRYRRSTDGGAGYGPVMNIAARETFIDPQIAVAPDGSSGLAAWTGIGNTTVRVVALDPQPEPLPPVVVERDPPNPPLPPADRTAPAISGLSISKSKVKPSQAVTFRFEISEAGSARLLIDRKAAGLKMKATAESKTATCLAKTNKRLSSLRKQLGRRSDVKRLRGARRSRKLRSLLRTRGCTTRQTLATLTSSVQAGVNTIVFSGKVKGRSLKSGSYRAVLTVTDPAGNVSTKKTTTFKVLAKKKAKKR